MTKKTKILITITVILLIVLVAVWYSSRPNKNEGKNVVLQSEPLISEIQEKQLSQAKEILGTLSLLETISLSLDFFDNPAFKSLYDFSVQLPVAEVGKNNPFAP